MGRGYVGWFFFFFLFFFWPLLFFFPFLFYNLLIVGLSVGVLGMLRKHRQRKDLGHDCFRSFDKRGEGYKIPTTRKVFHHRQSAPNFFFFFFPGVAKKTVLLIQTPITPLPFPLPFHLPPHPSQTVSKPQPSTPETPLPGQARAPHSPPTSR